jgi:hypothetical protein
MTREKKINQYNYIKSLIYLFIIKQGAFDWWLESYLFENIARTANCSVHKVKRVFYKDILLNDYAWLEQFTY